ncbi:MAG: trypsin-like peptidase domain-containing protein, partial [Polyangiaceae bacterium]
MASERGSRAIVGTTRLWVLPALSVTAALAAAPVAGCHDNKASAAQPLPNTAPPFASPPTLTGTPDIAALVAKVKPAVVNITSVHTERVRGGLLDVPGFPDLRGFFGFHEEMPGERGHGRHEWGGEEVLRQQALGSGFIIDDKAHVVTNAHVVDQATTVKVKLADDREFRAKVIGRDDRLDVAVIELERAPHDLPTASLGSSEALRVGEYVVAIGNPFGLGDTVTMGIVSAKDRSLGAGPYDDYVQTDASINPGNSGGPLFDLRGQVIGVNAAINPQGKGIGFAIPIDAVKQAVPQLIAKGRVSRGELGVEIQGVDQDLANALGLDRPRGALVEKVEP